MRMRTSVTSLHTTYEEADAPLPLPTHVALAAIVVENPLAGRGLVPDLSELETLGAEAAAYLVGQALAALASAGLGADEVRGYGKAAIVGSAGEREHTAAVLHPRFGAPVRAAIGGGADIIPGTKAVGPAGMSITVPIGNRHDRWEFDDMDSITCAIPDAPKANEMVIALALSIGGRPHARTKKPS